MAKHPRKINRKKERFILAHDFRGFHPWLEFHCLEVCGKTEAWWKCVALEIGYLRVARKKRNRTGREDPGTRHLLQ